jgi:outer membrane protein TolC
VSLVRLTRCAGVLGVVAIAAWPRAAAAETLAELLAAGRRSGLELAEARASADVAAAAVDVARAPLWPTLEVGLGYALNQDPASFPLGTETITIVPRHQLDARVALTVPLYDPSARAAVAVAVADRAVATAQLAVAERASDRVIVRAYYAWVGGAAAEAAAVNARAVAVDNLAVVERRAAAQLASPVDVARAQAAIADADATVASARLVVANAARQLATATGAPPVGPPPALPVDTAAEAPLASWLAGAVAEPELAAAPSPTGRRRGPHRRRARRVVAEPGRHRDRAGNDRDRLWRAGLRRDRARAALALRSGDAAPGRRRARHRRARGVPGRAGRAGGARIE